MKLNPAPKPYPIGLTLLPIQNLLLSPSNLLWLNHTMDFLTLFKHIDTFLSWKIIFPGFFISLVFSGLDFIPILHGILHDMFKYFVTSSIFFALLAICKIAFQLQELISWKRKIEHQEKNSLKNLLALPKREAALLKYLFFKQNKSA